MFVVDYNNAIIQFDEIIEKINEEKETAIVTGKNKQNVVIMSLDEYNKLMKGIYEKKNSDNDK